MKKSFSGYFLLVLLLILLVALAGCGNAEQPTEEAEQEEQVTDETEQEAQPTEETEQEEQLAEEATYVDVSVEVNGTTVTFGDIANDGALIVGDEMVIQTMIIKEDIPEEHVNKLAQEIAHYLREEYPDLIVTILADRVTGEELIHITMD